MTEHVHTHAHFTQWNIGCCCLVTMLCLTLLPTPTCQVSLSQARILEWVAISFSRGSSLPNPGIKPVSPALQTDSLSGNLLESPVEH